MSIKVQAVDIVGTVVSQGADLADEGHVGYLIVELDNGRTVRARPVGPLDYRPRQRGIVREVSSNYFRLKKYEFRGYIDKPREQ